MKTTIDTTILGFGKNAGIEVPVVNLTELGSSKRPPVIVKIGSYSYKSTIGVMNGKFMIPLANVHLEPSGLASEDKVTVNLTLDSGDKVLIYKLNCTLH